MNYSKFYLRLPIEEQIKWLSDLNLYWSSVKNDYTVFDDIADIVIKDLFSQYTLMNGYGSFEDRQQLGRQFRNQELSSDRIRVFMQTFMKNEYQYRYDWIEEHYPEALI